MAAQRLNPKHRATDGPLLALEAEQALIGCCIFEPTRIREAQIGIQPDHFSEPVHALIWKTINDVAGAGGEPDLATLKRWLSGSGELADGRYLSDLVDKCGSTNLVGQHGSEILDAFTRRAGVRMLNEAVQDLSTTGGRAAQGVLFNLRGGLERLERHSEPAASGLISARSAAETLVDALDYEATHGITRGIMTGLRCFDHRLGGLRPGALVTIGGRPSMGKTSLMRCTAYGAASRNPDQLFVIFSLEMSVRELIERGMSAATFQHRDGIPYSQFHALDRRERARLRELHTAQPSNVLIRDLSGASLERIARAVWALKARGPIGAVFIDYLQLMARVFQPGRSETLILGDITRELKTLAREAEICVVLLAQLNRAVESRDDRRPQLSDLRDSGSIEQDSDVVLFPYREAYYLERGEPQEVGSAAHQKWQLSLELKRRRMDVIAAKVRGGATGADRQVYFAEFDHVADETA